MDIFRQELNKDHSDHLSDGNKKIIGEMYTAINLKCACSEAQFQAVTAFFFNTIENYKAPPSRFELLQNGGAPSKMTILDLFFSMLIAAVLILSLNHFEGKNKIMENYIDQINNDIEDAHDNSGLTDNQVLTMVKPLFTRSIITSGDYNSTFFNYAQNITRTILKNNEEERYQKCVIPSNFFDTIPSVESLLVKIPFLPTSFTRELKGSVAKKDQTAQLAKDKKEAECYEILYNDERNGLNWMWNNLFSKINKNAVFIKAENEHQIKMYLYLRYLWGISLGYFSVRFVFKMSGTAPATQMNVLRVIQEEFPAGIERISAEPWPRTRRSPTVRTISPAAMPAIENISPAPGRRSRTVRTISPAPWPAIENISPAPRGRRFGTPVVNIASTPSPPPSRSNRGGSRKTHKRRKTKHKRKRSNSKTKRKRT